MASPTAFCPIGNTQSVNVGAASQAVAMPSIANQVRVYNAGTLPVFLNLSGSGAASLATGVPVPAGAVEVFTIPQLTSITAIASGASGNCYFTAGEGL